MPLDVDYTYCESLVRLQDRDRFLSALFAPAQARPHVLALYAFNIEVARVREVVREALPGEVRLQWWRDVIEGGARGDVSGNPVASALLDTLNRHPLPREALLNLIEARTFDLYDDPMPTLNDLEGYAGETASALIQLASLILAGEAPAGLAEAAGHGGVAQAMTGLMRALPLHAARGQCYLPLDVLARHGSRREDVILQQPTEPLRAALAELRMDAARHLGLAGAALQGLPASVAPAFLPLALVPGDLRALARARNPFMPRRGNAFFRQVRIWRAARRAARGLPYLPGMGLTRSGRPPIAG